LSEHRQVLPVDTAFPTKATIGGLTAVGSSGPRRLGYGPLRDLIIGMSVISTDGVVTKGGGQVVKNVTGFDMMRLHHGALGSLGIIVSVNLKVIPKPQSERSVVAKFHSLDKADAASREVLSSQLGVTALVVTNPDATRVVTEGRRDSWALCVRCEAPPSAVVRQAERVREYVQDLAEDLTIEDSTDESAALWSRISRSLDQRPSLEEFSIRLGVTASRLRDAAGRVEQTLPSGVNPRLTLDYGSGLLYVQASEASIQAEKSSILFKQLSTAGDHIALMTASPSLKAGLADVFGNTPAGFSVLQSLKETFDPDRILNPGRPAGRL
jgi:glycolate oxidase FAD binding subunit